MAKAISIRLDLASQRALAASLLNWNHKIHGVIKGALDDVAANVQRLARAGHPLPPKVVGVKKASVVFRGKWERDSLRDFTGSAGMFTGMMRYLTVTGATTLSIHIDKAKRSGRGYVAEVFSGLPHSVDLEFGTANRRAFPFMRPAAIQSDKPGKEHVRKAIARALI